MDYLQQHFADKLNRYIVGCKLKKLTAAEKEELLIMNPCPRSLTDQQRDKKLKEIVASKLKGYHDQNELDGLVPLDKGSILFTDWMVGDEEANRAIGMCGVEAVKDRIR